MDPGSWTANLCPFSFAKRVGNKCVIAAHFFARELLMIASIIAVIIILLEHFSTVMTPFLFDGWPECMIGLLFPLIMMEMRRIRRNEFET
jgi:hypothetical protein